MSPLGITASLRGAPGEAHGAIEDLACAVRKLGERHAADHDVLRRRPCRSQSPELTRTWSVELGAGRSQVQILSPDTQKACN
jgi:hypothetical protein